MGGHAARFNSVYGALSFGSLYSVNRGLGTLDWGVGGEVVLWRGVLGEG